MSSATAGEHTLRSAGKRNDYAIEGMLIGAGALGIAVAVVGSQHCESDCGLDKTVLGFVVGAALGAIPGLLIGGLIPRDGP